MILISKISKQLTAFTLALAVGMMGFGFILTTNTQAQTRNRRVNDRQVEQIIRSVEQQSDRFRKSFDLALDKSRLDGTYTEDDLNNRVKAFEEATNALRSKFNKRMTVASDVDNILNRGAAIEQFMRTNLRLPQAQNDWSLLKGDLNRLATAYNVSFNLNGRVLPPSVVAAQRAYRVSDSQVQTLLNRIETKSNTFRSSLDRALDRSRFNSTRSEDNINEFVKSFENSTDTLRSKFDGRTSVGADVEMVLVRATAIDDFMNRNLRSNSAAQRDWKALRTDLNQLSNYYSLSFNLDNRRNMPSYAGYENSTGANASFTGTYRLNASQSDNARTVADNATRYVRTNNRTEIYNRLTNRLAEPELLAVERQGTRVVLASSRSPQVILDVDNRDHLESYPNGRTSTVIASFSGDTLTVVSKGDRTNDFTAVFTPLDNGRRMMVTRRVYAEQLAQPIEVKSYYDRTSTGAQFNIYNGTNYPSNTTGSVMNTFFVPDNTMLTAVLNTNISTKTVLDGDRFTMTVNSPSQYSGATIEGYISNVNRSGRIAGRSEITLNYETIRLRNNQTYRFAGLTENVRTNSGDDVRVNNEGTVGDDSQTDKTVGRTAIGAGIGALLGAIINGGKGAAIGAAIGAGTGAGSVYVQGRDELNLMNGTELTIRAASPRVP